MHVNFTPRGRAHSALASPPSLHSDGQLGRRANQRGVHLTTGPQFGPGQVAGRPCRALRDPWPGRRCLRFGPFLKCICGPSPLSLDAIEVVVRPFPLSPRAGPPLSTLTCTVLRLRHDIHCPRLPFPRLGSADCETNRTAVGSKVALSLRGKHDPCSP